MRNSRRAYEGICKINISALFQERSANKEHRPLVAQRLNSHFLTCK